MNVGNPWYRQSRNGEVQGRAGGTGDAKADSNPAPPNPSASVVQPAASGSTGK